MFLASAVASKMVRRAESSAETIRQMLMFLLDATSEKRVWTCVRTLSYARPKSGTWEGGQTRSGDSWKSIAMYGVRASALVGRRVEEGSRLAATLYFVLQGATLWGCIRLGRRRLDDGMRVAVCDWLAGYTLLPTVRAHSYFPKARFARSRSDGHAYTERSPCDVSPTSSSTAFSTPRIHFRPSAHGSNQQ